MVAEGIKKIRYSGTDCDQLPGDDMLLRRGAHCEEGQNNSKGVLGQVCVEHYIPENDNEKDSRDDEEQWRDGNEEVWGWREVHDF